MQFLPALRLSVMDSGKTASSSRAKKLGDPGEQEFFKQKSREQNKRKKRRKERETIERQKAAKRHIERRAEIMVQERMKELDQVPAAQDSAQEVGPTAKTRKSSSRSGTFHEFKEISPWHVVRPKHVGSCYLGFYRGFSVFVNEWKGEKEGERKRWTQHMNACGGFFWRR